MAPLLLITIIIITSIIYLFSYCYLFSTNKSINQSIYLPFFTYNNYTVLKLKYNRAGTLSKLCRAFRGQPLDKFFCKHDYHLKLHVGIID